MSFVASSASVLSFTSRSEAKSPLGAESVVEALLVGGSRSGGTLSSSVLSEILFQNVKDFSSYFRRYLNDVVEVSTAAGCVGQIEEVDETDFSGYLRRYLNDVDGILTEEEEDDPETFEASDNFNRADGADNGDWLGAGIGVGVPEVSGNEVIFHSDPTLNPPNLWYPASLTPGDVGAWCTQEVQLTFKSFGTITNGGRAAGGIFIFASIDALNGYFFTYAKNKVHLGGGIYIDRYDIGLHKFISGVGTTIGSSLDIAAYPSGTVFKINGVHDEDTGYTRVIVYADDVIIFDVNVGDPPFSVFGRSSGVFGIGTWFLAAPNSDCYWDDFSGFAISCESEGGGPEVCPVEFNEIAETVGSGYLRRYLNDKVS